MCDNKQYVQVNINQNNNCNSNSASDTGDMEAIVWLILGGSVIIFLVFTALGAALSAIGSGLTSFAKGVAAVPWLEIIGGTLLGIAVFALAVFVFCFSLVKGRDYVSAASERRKQRKIIDLQPIEEEASVQLAPPQMAALQQPEPVKLLLTPLNAYDHEQAD